MKPFLPQKLPLIGLDIGRLIRLVGTANAAIARYDGLLQGVVNPSVMLSPLTQREAVLSSKIEGTQATVDEVLEFEAGIEFDPEKTNDIQEIVNYRKALRLSSEAIEKGPIDLLLILQMHSVLMDSVRGSRKSSGKFRTEQNWIGPDGLQDQLKDLESYMAGDDIDPLVQTAVAHAQFEILHPFEDGNGRIGRLLIPLFLFQKKVLASPMFYLSEYLESHRDQYYARLRAISDDGDWTGWIEFFLAAIEIQASSNAKRVTGILSLYNDMKVRVPEITHSQYSPAILDAIFDRPIFQTHDFIQRSNIPKPTATTAIRKLKEAEILVEIRSQSGRRGAVLAFRDLLNLAEGKPVL